MSSQGPGRLNTRTRRARRFRLRCRWRFPRASSRFLLPRDRPRRHPSRFTSRFMECTRSTRSARRTRRGWRSSARGSPPEFRRPPPISCHSREQRLWAVSFFWLFLVIFGYSHMGNCTDGVFCLQTRPRYPPSTRKIQSHLSTHKHRSRRMAWRAWRRRWRRTT